jgi:hypothetical protein
MMMLRKTMTKFKAQPEAPASPSLEEQLRAARAAASQLIEEHVDAIKRGEGSTLPRDWIMQNQYALHRSHGCLCKLALKILEEKK